MYTVNVLGVKQTCMQSTY